MATAAGSRVVSWVLAGAIIGAGALGAWAQTGPSDPNAARDPSEFNLDPAVPPAEEPAPEFPDDVRPLGFSGRSSVGRDGVQRSGEFLPIPDRWRIGLPADYREDLGGRGRLIDPYNQNVLKGDYPIWDQDKFLVVTLTSDTLLETRKLPVPSGVSSLRPDSLDFFGMGEQYFINQNFIVSFSLFKGDAGYKPRDWEIRVTPVFNLNYVKLEELGGVRPDVRSGRHRNDSWIGFQEAFVEYRFPYESANFDFTSVRAGIQGFVSDFRGFLFSDDQPGVRLFGTLDNNLIQWNLAWFHTLEKDTNSGLNSYTARNDQDVFIANVFFQDSLRFLRPRTTNEFFFGYTTQFSFHANFDDSADEVQLDDNGFIVRPAPIGTVQTGNEIRAYYLGWAGDGHIGRINISHQFYQALGEETLNAIAGQETDINAQFFAVELSYDQDWIRYRTSFVYASGDSDARDDEARGFDSIFDNPNFAGGGFSFLTRQAIRLTGTGVNLVNRNSFLPDLRTSKEQGQANFVNPGLFMYNVGLDAELTPKLKAILNISYIQFAQTDSLDILLHDNNIDRDFGIDYSIGLQYRPYLNNNAIITVGAALLQPLSGFTDIYDEETLYSVFTSFTFTY